MKTVLVVDDEQIVLDVLQRILNRLGYEVEITDSGSSALERFSDETFDLVLMDVLMPEKNGFEIAKEMKRVKPDQKIILVTGIGADAAAAQAMTERVGIDYVLSKPFSYEKVRTVVANAINGVSQLANQGALYS